MNGEWMELYVFMADTKRTLDDQMQVIRDLADMKIGEYGSYEDILRVVKMLNETLNLLYMSSPSLDEMDIKFLLAKVGGYQL